MPLSCVNVSVMVLNQMKLWNMSAECGTSEKCFYTVSREVVGGEEGGGR